MTDREGEAILKLQGCALVTLGMFTGASFMHLAATYNVLTPWQVMFCTFVAFVVYFALSVIYSFKPGYAND
jgi:hypothetical protein